MGPVTEDPHASGLVPEQPQPGVAVVEDRDISPRHQSKSFLKSTLAVLRML